MHWSAHSHHGLFETTRVIDLPRPEGPLPSENYWHHCAKCCQVAFVPAMGIILLALPTLHSERCVKLSTVIGQTNKPTCLESLKIPGRYQVTIMPCVSTITHGVEDLTPFSRGYRHFNLASFSFDALVPGFKGIFGSFSAYHVMSHSIGTVDKNQQANFHFLFY